MTEAVLVTHFAAKEEAVVKADSLPLTVGLVQVTPLPRTVVLGQVGLLPRAAEVERFGAQAQPVAVAQACLLYTSPSPRDRTRSRMPSSA